MKTTINDYAQRQAERLARLGRVRTSETYLATLRSLMRFTENRKLTFNDITTDLMEQYEAHLRQQRLSRNSSSFYMRVLRRLYNMAVADGLTRQKRPFQTVYTGIDKTTKRAISLQDIRRIKNLDLSQAPTLDYARDMFLFSFYMRGMSFIDMAYLQKSDLRNGFVTYSRKKTNQRLVIRWEEEMQHLVDKYDTHSTPYILPIIKTQDGTERRQYLRRLLFVNRKLKAIAQLASIPTPLSMYVARHSWASIARDQNVPISIISGGLGHDSEQTTQIYLASIRTELIDEANSMIIHCL